MKVKIVKGETTAETENEINNFLSDRKDIKIIDIREVQANTIYVFIIMYEYKEEK